MGRKFGFSFSWRRALGLSAAKGKLSRAIGIPLTKSGRQRKAGRLLGDIASSALIAGTQIALKSGSSQSKIPPNLPPFDPNVTPHLASIWDEGENASEELRLHGKSLILATQKPKGWQHLLFAQVIIDEVEKSKSALVLACGPIGLRAGAISSPVVFADWCATRIDEMRLLADQISKFELTANSDALGSVSAIISFSRPIRLFCQRCVEWAQDISNAPLDPHFREVARDLLVVSHHFIESVDRFGNELLRQLENALSKPPGSQVTIDACLKVDFPDLTRFLAAVKKLEG